MGNSHRRKFLRSLGVAFVGVGAGCNNLSETRTPTNEIQPPTRERQAQARPSPSKQSNTPTTTQPTEQEPTTFEEASSPLNRISSVGNFGNQSTSTGKLYSLHPTEAGVVASGSIDGTVVITSLTPFFNQSWLTTLDNRIQCVSPRGQTVPLTTTPTGGYLIGTRQEDATEQTVVVATDSDGNIQWQQKVGDEPSGTAVFPIQISPDRYITAEVWFGSNHAATYLRNTRISTENTIWERRFDDGNWQAATRLQRANNAEEGVYLIVDGYPNHWIGRFDTAGSQQWRQQAESGTDHIYTLSDGFLHWGYLPNASETKVRKFDSERRLKWTRTLTVSAESERVEAVAEANDGSLLLIWVADTDLVLTKIASDGSSVDIHKLAFERSIERVYDAVRTDGQYIVCGADLDESGWIASLNTDLC